MANEIQIGDTVTFPTQTGDKTGMVKRLYSGLRADNSKWQAAEVKTKRIPNFKNQFILSTEFLRA